MFRCDFQTLSHMLLLMVVEILLMPRPLLRWFPTLILLQQLYWGGWIY